MNASRRNVNRLFYYCTTFSGCINKCTYIGAVLNHCDNYDFIVATKCQEIPGDSAIFSDTTILQLSPQAIK